MKNKKFLGRVFTAVLAGAMVLSMAAFAAECTHPIGYLKIDNEDGETHHFECVTCNETVEEMGNEAHTYKADGFCACGAKAPVIPDEDFDAAMNVETETVVITVTYMCDGAVVKTVDYTMDGESDTFTVTAPNGFVFSKNFNTELNVCDENGKVVTNRTVFVHVDEAFDSDIFVDADGETGYSPNPDEYYPLDGDMLDAGMSVSRSWISVIWDFLFGWTRYIF